MHLPNRFAHIVLSPAVLAIIIGLLVIFFLPPVFDKYIFKRIDHKILDEDRVVSFHDIDKDGYSEKIIYYDNDKNINHLIVETKGKIIDQWNFRGQLRGGNFFHYCDYDQDGIDEIFVLTYSNDSIFITGIKPFQPDPPKFFEIFVDRFGSRNGVIDFGSQFAENPVPNENGYIDLVFSIWSGFGLQPRNLYSVDITNESIKKSPQSGTSIYRPLGYDLNNNGYLEFIGESLAVGNHSPEFPYSDHQSWLMVFNRNMEFLFDPIPFGYHKTWLDVKPFRPSTINYLLLLQRHPGFEDIPNLLMLYDIHGNELKRRDIGEKKMIEFFFLLPDDTKNCQKISLVYSDGTIEEIDSTLATKKITQLDIYHDQPFRKDIDQDGKDEFLFFNTDRNSMILTRNDFSHPVKTDLFKPHYGNSYFSVVEDGDNQPEMYLQLNEVGYYFKYHENPLYSLKYLIWFSVIITLFVFFYILQRIQRKRASIRYDTEKKIAELQLKSIKSQIDPHFTLNLLDSIGYLFYKQDLEKANLVFGKYARLLRETILSSDNIATTLEHEIDYVKTYLDLEKFRFDGKFDYEIKCLQGSLLKTEMPKRIIHTFAENALKHGLKNKQGKGFIEITVLRKNYEVVIEIKDDGIGREASKKYSKLSTGKGLEMVNKILDLYYDLKKVRITYSIMDLESLDNNQEGTMVIVRIPIRSRR